MAKLVDLFAGVGGLGLGFEQSGFTVQAAYEIWDKACVVHSENLDCPVHRFDLSCEDSAAEHIAPYAPDLIIGGPPCQDFSSAGKRQEGKNANLTLSFAHIISLVKPRLFVMENVARAKASASYTQAREVFHAAGYGLTEMVLDASRCGVPQRRKRFFCIGAQDMPERSFCESLSDAQTSKPLSVADYLQHEIDLEFYYRPPRSYARRAIYSTDEPSATIRGVNRPIPPNYPGHHLDAAAISQARPLTTFERSRIQTFPKTWAWQGNKTSVEQMIGNAVPVELGKFVGHAIMAAMP